MVFPFTYIIQKITKKHTLYCGLMEKLGSFGEQFFSFEIIFVNEVVASLIYFLYNHLLLLKEIGMITNLNAEEFFEKISPHVLGKTGNIIFTLNDISVTINTKDSIGNMLQDWIEAWAIQNKIYIRPNPQTQEFPDFYLSESNEDDLLEIKSFDAHASPNFDIANFDTYVRSLLENPKKLDAHYLVFSYSLNNGKITVEGVWLKRIWELSTSSNSWDLKLQVKQGTIYNIRPVNFVSKRANIAQAFKNKLEFLEAIQNVLNQYDKTKGQYGNWLNTFKEKYQEATGTFLE